MKTMKTRLPLLLLAFLLATTGSTIYATTRPLTPIERIATQRAELRLDVTDADANQLIPRILERTGLHYTFIRSQEERLLSLKTKGDPILILETVAFAAGFNIHKDGNYWVIYPLPIDENDIVN
jgi:hypothetical protein